MLVSQAEVAVPSATGLTGDVAAALLLSADPELRGKKEVAFPSPTGLSGDEAAAPLLFALGGKAHVGRDEG